MHKKSIYKEKESGTKALNKKSRKNIGKKHVRNEKGAGREKKMKRRDNRGPGKELVFYKRKMMTLTGNMPTLALSYFFRTTGPAQRI